ncbi:MAG TPA: sulfotransferase [Solirubrobacteraceae bacterium]|nr:sulfotransferase [Solirubrobacteraceae bacterium]
MGAVRGRVPDFLIVGHPKCGTTALWEMLRQHPQIYMPDIKEVRFFAADLHPSAEQVPAGARRTFDQVPAGARRTFDQYTALFAGSRADQRAGEASPLYLYSEVAAGEIAAAAPAARAIAILREPAAFLRSLHMQWVRSHFEDEKSFAKAISLEDRRRRGVSLPPSVRGRPQMLFYSEYVRYVEQLRRFHEALGRERVLALVYDDFRADNAGAIREVLRFIGVDERTPIAVKEVNTSVQMRSQRLDRAVHAVSVGRSPVAGAVKRAVKAVAPRGVRRRALAVTRERVVFTGPQPVDERLTNELRRRFKGEVVALSEYLNRDLVGLWGYDRLG